MPVERKPPEKAMMDRLAPNTAALDTPSVDGEAMVLPSVVCMMRPDTDRPAPAMSAASRRGMRIFQMIRAAVPSIRPSRADRHSAALIRDEPTSRQAKAASTTAQASMTTTTVFFRVRALLPSMCVLLRAGCKISHYTANANFAQAGRGDGSQVSCILHIDISGFRG